MRSTKARAAQSMQRRADFPFHLRNAVRPSSDRGASRCDATHLGEERRVVEPVQRLRYRDDIDGR